MLEVSHPVLLCCKSINNVAVGFTGSGHEMRKDPTRSRNIYQEGGED